MQPAIQAEVQQALSDYARAFPRRARTRLTSCQDISGGWEGELLCVQLSYAEEGQERADELVLKLYAGSSGPQKARREFRALRWLAGVGYPAPQALFASARDAVGRAYVAMERIAGETVAHLLEAATGRQRRALSRRCCRLYADLHALDWEPGWELCGEELVGEREEVVQAWLAQVRAACQQRLPGVFEPALAWLQERSREVVCRRVCYLHGDFHFNNVMLREDGRLVVIDWTGPQLSDYRFDVGWTLLLLRTQGRAQLAAPLLAEYQRRAGRPVEQLAFFEAAACCRRLFDLVCSTRGGGGGPWHEAGGDRGNRAPERSCPGRLCQAAGMHGLCAALYRVLHRRADWGRRAGCACASHSSSVREVLYEKRSGVPCSTG